MNNLLAAPLGITDWLSPTRAAVPYAATATHGVWVSTDVTAASPTWTPASSSIPFTDTLRVAFDDADPGTLYVTTHGGGAWRTLKPSYRSHRQQLIRRRAYEIYRGRAGAPGTALGDWVEAERQLLESATRTRAYELFELRGRTDGRHAEDWLRAERETRRAVRG